MPDITPILTLDLATVDRSLSALRYRRDHTERSIARFPDGLARQSLRKDLALDVTAIITLELIRQVVPIRLNSDVTLLALEKAAHGGR